MLLTKVVKCERKKGKKNKKWHTEATKQVLLAMTMKPHALGPNTITANDFPRLVLESPGSCVVENWSDEGM